MNFARLLDIDKMWHKSRGFPILQQDEINLNPFQCDSMYRIYRIILWQEYYVERRNTYSPFPKIQMQFDVFAEDKSFEKSVSE